MIKGKPKYLYILLIIALFLPFFSINQMMFWVSRILSILLVFSIVILKNGGRLRNIEAVSLVVFFLFFLWVLISGFFSMDAYNPLRKSIEILICIVFLLGIFLINNTYEDFVFFLRSISYTGIILSFYVLFSLNDNFIAENIISGKSPTAFFFLTSILSTVVLKEIKSDLFIDTFIIIIMSISLLLMMSVKMIIPLFLLLFYYFRDIFKSSFINKKNILFFFIGGWLYSVKGGVFESTNYLMVSSKIAVVFGYEPKLPFAHNDVSFRQSLIENTLSIFYNNPILGIGLENNRLILGTYSHNNTTELLAGGGIIAFLLFYFPVLYVFIINKLKYDRSILLSLLIVFSMLIIGHAQRLYDSNSFFIIFSILLLTPRYYEKK